MAIVIVTLSVTISKIFIVEMYVTVTLILEWAKAKRKYAKQKPIYDLLFDRNRNVLHISHNFQDIHCRNVHALDIDF